jgi:hypothetical protein
LCCRHVARGLFFQHSPDRLQEYESEYTSLEGHRHYSYSWSLLGLRGNADRAGKSILSYPIRSLVVSQAFHEKKRYVLNWQRRIDDMQPTPGFCQLSDYFYFFSTRRIVLPSLELTLIAIIRPHSRSPSSWADSMFPQCSLIR